MKKYMLSMLTLALFVVGFVSSGASDESDQSNFIGTYEVTDKVGSTMRIKLNEDESATITSVRGENVILYCSWSESLDCGIGIHFSDQKPNLVYEGGAIDIYSSCVYIKDGWLYSGYSNAKAKNPQWRLKITKIN